MITGETKKIQDVYYLTQIGVSNNNTITTDDTNEWNNEYNTNSIWIVFFHATVFLID